MIEHHLDRATGILHVRPRSALEAADFAGLAQTADPYIEEKGALGGLVIETPAFPGWDSLGALAAHVRFVRDHHRSVRRIALVTDSAIGDVAEKLASHFVAAEIRRFPAGQRAAAEAWIATGA